MNDIYERFQNLPRGRKGSKTVVIVEEGELARLIADAQASEGALMARAARAHRDLGDRTPAPLRTVERAPWLRDPHAP